MAEASTTSDLVLIGNQTYDFNNISGKKRAALVKAGTVRPERFIAGAANMPGKKLAALRKAQLEQQEVAKTYAVDDIVMYKGVETTILELKDDEAKITNRKGKEIWVPKIKLASPTVVGEVENEENSEG